MRGYGLLMMLGACGWLLAVGCGDKLDPIDMTIDTSKVGPVGFDPDVLAVFETYCNRCHASGAGNRHGAPRRVNYDKYADAKKWAQGALNTMKSGSMPPSDEPAPTGPEISIIAAWIEQGEPE